MGKHHLMIGTWVKPGVIITVAFDDEKLTLELVKKTEIQHDEPISWMAFDVCAVVYTFCFVRLSWLTGIEPAAPEKEHLWREHEEMEQPQSGQSERDCAYRQL